MVVALEDIEAFADGDEKITDYFGSSQDAFADMCDDLIMHERYADLFGSELDQFYQYAYRHWANHLTQYGVDWINLFGEWEAEG